MKLIRIRKSLISKVNTVKLERKNSKILIKTHQKIESKDCFEEKVNRGKKQVGQGDNGPFSRCRVNGDKEKKKEWCVPAC